MTTVDLDELEKAKALIDGANGVPLEEVQWVRSGQPVDVPKILIDDWKFIGLSNTYFAYEYLIKGE